MIREEVPDFEAYFIAIDNGDDHVLQDKRRAMPVWTFSIL